ncbi:discoidin domain-containing protein [Dactylosporangium sp. NPDC050588]|uniref:discoidin domain-containing protein n=1 Tax=Dactylosporangium sp. NPDC050588 TaxID=3157211 RepID=UPI0033EEDA07
MRSRLLAVLALLTAGLVAAPPPAGAAEAVLSQNKPVTASSVEHAGTPATAAVDGNTGTRWSSAFTANAWIQVDLGAPAALSRVASRPARSATCTPPPRPPPRCATSPPPPSVTDRSPHGRPGFAGPPARRVIVSR